MDDIITINSETHGPKIETMVLGLESNRTWSKLLQNPTFQVPKVSKSKLLKSIKIQTDRYKDSWQIHQKSKNVEDKLKNVDKYNEKQSMIESSLIHAEDRIIAYARDKMHDYSKVKLYIYTYTISEFQIDDRKITPKSIQSCLPYVRCTLESHAVKNLRVFLVHVCVQVW